MAWNPQGGGPWGGGGGGGQGPWGGGPSSQQPPDIEEMLRRSQDKFKRFLPGGMGGKRSFILVALVLVGLWLGSGIYRVQPQERGVELVFGKLWERTFPGLQYNFPAPIGEVYTPQVTRENQVEVGFRSSPNGRSGGTKRDVIQESLMLTGDENIIDIQFVVFWKIKDAAEFLFKIRNPEQTVKDAAESAMREIIGQTEFELARTKGRGSIDNQVGDLIQKILDGYQAGIEITTVKMQKVDPPGAVIDSFRDVQAARADKERSVNEATAYLNEVTQRAEGEAAKEIAQAEAYRAEKIAKAQGESQRFISVFKEYQQDKKVTTRRMYLETMKDILKDMDKVIIEDSKGGGSNVVPYLPLDRLQNRPSTGGN